MFLSLEIITVNQLLAYLTGDISSIYKQTWGAQVTQSVKHPTFDFGSGYVFTVRETEPRVGLDAERGACLGFPLSLSLPLH